MERIQPGFEPESSLFWSDALTTKLLELWPLEQRQTQFQFQLDHRFRPLLCRKSRGYVIQ